jgi:hypothetical protein
MPTREGVNDRRLGLLWQDMAAHACKTLGLEMVPGLSMKVLPGEVEGFDGGYAACLRKKQE